MIHFVSLLYFRSICDLPSPVVITWLIGSKVSVCSDAVMCSPSHCVVCGKIGKECVRVTCMKHRKLLEWSFGFL